MALSSYFLVTTQHRIPEIRRAGFLYLLIAHVGAISILLSFGVLQGGSWKFTFDAMREPTLQPAWASVAFLLALFGFGAKAGPGPAPRVAAGGTSRSALAGLGDDERADAQDRRVRRAAGDLRPAPHLAVVVGCAGARDRAVHRAARRGLRRGPDRHEEAARLFLDRERGDDLLRDRPGDPLPGLRSPALRGARAERRPDPLAQPRLLQEPALPRHRLGPPCDGGAQPRQARWADPPDALGGGPGPGGDAGHRRAAAAQRLRLRVAAAPGVPGHAADSAALRQHAGPARRSGPRPDRCALPPT